MYSKGYNDLKFDTPPEIISGVTLTKCGYELDDSALRIITDRYLEDEPAKPEGLLFKDVSEKYLNSIPIDYIYVSTLNFNYYDNLLNKTLPLYSSNQKFPIVSDYGLSADRHVTQALVPAEHVRLNYMDCSRLKIHVLKTLTIDGSDGDLTHFTVENGCDIAINDCDNIKKLPSGLKLSKLTIARCPNFVYTDTVCSALFLSYSYDQILGCNILSSKITITKILNVKILDKSLNLQKDDLDHLEKLFKERFDCNVFIY